MTHYVLEPEVAGGLGPASTGALNARPLKLSKFNYEFDVWPHDQLLEAISNYIVTTPVKECLVAYEASGVAFGDVEITKSEEFQDRYPDYILPSYSWLRVTGQPGRDDFGLSATGDLVVSERALKLLEGFGLSECEISEYHPKGKP